MSTRRWFLLTAGCLLCVATGCFSARAPERIDVRVGNGSRPEPVDSARVPDPQTLEQARAELRKAYAHIQWLERRVAKLEEDKQEYKRERDKCKDRLERYEDD
jgi:predicted RNase H-like nuclease (RuvC/YqgF family)